MRERLQYEKDRKEFLKRIRISFQNQTDPTILGRERKLADTLKKMLKDDFNGEETLEEYVSVIESRMDEAYLKIIDLLNR